MAALEEEEGDVRLFDANSPMKRATASTTGSSSNNKAGGGIAVASVSNNSSTSGSSTSSKTALKAIRTIFSDCLSLCCG